MSVSNSESQKNYQSLIDAGMTADSISSTVKNLGMNVGGKYNPQETSAILGSFRSTGNPYSAENIAQAVTNPVSKPNLSDPMGLYDYYQNTPDMVNARNEVKGLTDKLNTFDTRTNQQQLNIENTGDETMSYIPGAQAQAAKQRGIEREGLARDLMAKQSFLSSLQEESKNKTNIGLGEISWKRGLILDNPSAGISFTDNLDTMASKIQQSQEKSKIESLRLQYPQLSNKIKSGMSFSNAISIIGKGLEKQEVKSIYMQTFGSSGSGMSKKEMEGKLKKYFKNEYSYTQEKRNLEIESIKQDLHKKKLGSTSIISNNNMSSLDNEYKTMTGYSGANTTYDYGDIFSGGQNQSFAIPGVDY